MKKSSAEGWCTVTMQVRPVFATARSTRMTTAAARESRPEVGCGRGRGVGESGVGWGRVWVVGATVYNPSPVIHQTQSSCPATMKGRGYYPLQPPSFAYASETPSFAPSSRPPYSRPRPRSFNTAPLPSPFPPHLIAEDDGRVGHELHADGKPLALSGGQAVGRAHAAHLAVRDLFQSAGRGKGEGGGGWVGEVKELVAVGRWSWHSAGLSA